jgi:hypothetical protein
MAFGNYKIKADFGGERITDRNSATAFMLTLTAIYRKQPHWKLADQALRQASKSAAAESRASAAFKAAIEASVRTGRLPSPSRGESGIECSGSSNVFFSGPTGPI